MNKEHPKKEQAVIKPLSAISDEDIIESAYLNWPKERGNNVDLEFVKSLVPVWLNNTHIYQFLESKGYEVPPNPCNGEQEEQIKDIVNIKAE